MSTTVTPYTNTTFNTTPNSVVGPSTDTGGTGHKTSTSTVPVAATFTRAGNVRARVEEAALLFGLVGSGGLWF